MKREENEYEVDAIVTTDLANQCIHGLADCIYFQVYEGTSISPATVVREYCHQSALPQGDTVIIPGHILTLVFITDRVTSGTGFRLRYSSKSLCWGLYVYALNCGWGHGYVVTYIIPDIEGPRLFTTHEKRMCQTYRFNITPHYDTSLLPDTYNYRLRMRRECRERFPHHLFQRKPHVVIANPWWGKSSSAFPAHAQPAILRIWQEIHG